MRAERNQSRIDIDNPQRSNVSENRWEERQEINNEDRDNRARIAKIMVEVVDWVARCCMLATVTTWRRWVVDWTADLGGEEVLTAYYRNKDICRIAQYAGKDNWDDSTNPTSNGVLTRLRFSGHRSVDATLLSKVSNLVQALGGVWLSS